MQKKSRISGLFALFHKLCYGATLLKTTKKFQRMQANHNASLSILLVACVAAPEISPLLVIFPFKLIVYVSVLPVIKKLF
jgi:hypothetical protein